MSAEPVNPDFSCLTIAELHYCIHRIDPLPISLLRLSPCLSHAHTHTSLLSFSIAKVSVYLRSVRCPRRAPLKLSFSSVAQLTNVYSWRGMNCNYFMPIRTCVSHIFAQWYAIKQTIKSEMSTHKIGTCSDRGPFTNWGIKSCRIIALLHWFGSTRK